MMLLLLPSSKNAICHHKDKMVRCFLSLHLHNMRHLSARTAQSLLALIFLAPALSDGMYSASVATPSWSVACYAAN